MGAIPTGTVTLLFTDIEESTRAWQQQPDAMRSALERHDDLVRDAVTSRAGYVFKTVGDAFCVAFGDPLEALRAAVDVQRRLTAAAWETATPLRVRMALHSGSCEERDADYFGPTVNRVARLLSLAHGGQALASGATVALLPARLEAEIGLRDLGRHRLKDLDEPEDVWQVVGDGLEADFPPLRSVDPEADRHNLPEQLTTFVGRARDVAGAKAMLGEARLVTLAGPGGAGKTRLALEVAAAELGEHRDGVWLVELAPVLDPDNVARAIASTLRVRGRPDRSAIETLIEALRTRNMLLVIDNCEHVVEAAARAADALVRACADVKVLATSREPLGIGGEHVVRLSSLPDAEAVALFVDRVRLHDASFEVDASSVATVERLCRRLDGFPLALELAAARARTLSIRAIDARLDERFQLLTTGSRAGDPRQRTLEAALDWSYDLLEPRERLLFGRLSVFVGGWDLVAAESVCTAGPIHAADVWELLASLVDKSLVQLESSASGQRYGLLETMRAYAAIRVREEGGDAQAELRSRHRDHYLALAEATDPLVRTAGGREALHRLALELENMRAALAASSQDGQVGSGLRMAVALSEFWRARGFLAESLEWLTAFADPAEGQTLLGARAAYALGDLLMRLSRYEEAARELQRSLAIGHAIGDEAIASRASSALAFLAYLEGDAETALERSAEAIESAERAGDTAVLAIAVARHADSFDAAGQPARVRELLEAALVLARTADDEPLLGSILNNSAEAALYFDDFDTARSRLEEAVAVATRRDDISLLTYAKRNLGGVLLRQGDALAADPVLCDALDLAERVGAPIVIAYALLGQAEVALALGDVERAAVLHGAAEAVFATARATPEPLEEKRRSENEGQLRSAMGDEGYDEAFSRGRALDRDAAIAFARRR